MLNCSCNPYAWNPALGRAMCPIHGGAARDDTKPAECATCEEIKRTGEGPSHNGSPNCESGSIASGGTVAHCACDVCF